MRSRDASVELISLRFTRTVSRAWFPNDGDYAHPVFETTMHDFDLLLWYDNSPCTELHAGSRSLTGRRYLDTYFVLLQNEGGPVGYLETARCMPAGAAASGLTETWHGPIDAKVAIVGTERAATLNALESGLSIWALDRVPRPGPSLLPALHSRLTGALREEDAHFIRRVAARLTGMDPGADRVASLPITIIGLRIAAATVGAANHSVPVKIVAPA